MNWSVCLSVLVLLASWSVRSGAAADKMVMNSLPASVTSVSKTTCADYILVEVQIFNSTSMNRALESYGEIDKVDGRVGVTPVSVSWRQKGSEIDIGELSQMTVVGNSRIELLAGKRKTIYLLIRAPLQQGNFTLYLTMERPEYGPNFNSCAGFSAEANVAMRADKTPVLASSNSGGSEPFPANNGRAGGPPQNERSE